MKVLRVKSPEEGAQKAFEILKEKVDLQTTLFLSGGKTPKELYENLAKDKSFKPGAVAMVDDRYSLHFENSNEVLLKDSGLLDSLDKKNVPFYSILKYGKNKEQLARDYGETVSYLLNHFHKSMAVLGIGEDGHIAGILPRARVDKGLYIQYFYFSDAEFKERITLTFTAFSLFDLLILLVFGEKKKKALEEMFKAGPIEEVPARFLNQNLPEKTLLITDQKI